MLRIVILGNLVKHFGVVLQSLKSMSKSLWNVEAAAIVRREHNSGILFVGRRFRTEIDDDIVKRSPNTANNLGFFEWRHLIVHSAQRTFARVEREAALSDVRLQTCQFKFPDAKCSGEESARILMWLDVDQKCSP